MLVPAHNNVSGFGDSQTAMKRSGGSPQNFAGRQKYRALQNKKQRKEKRNET
jgi:hypothetical protein